MKYKDILIRALKTFVQAFIPVVAAAFATADLTELDNLKAVAYSALISGAAAGISAVWNVIIQLTEKKEPDAPIPDDVEFIDIDEEDVD